MLARRVTPILNVSDLAESFGWFEKLGWKMSWEWGDPPTFGSVCSGECEIFLFRISEGLEDTDEAQEPGGPGA